MPIEKLKQYPLIGISLAVACGLVLVHILNQIWDAFWRDSLESFLAEDGWTLFGWVIAAALLTLIVRRRRSVLAWVGRHEKGIVIGAFVVFGICCGLIALRVSNPAAPPTPVTFTGPAIPIQ